MNLEHLEQEALTQKQRRDGNKTSSLEPVHFPDAAQTPDDGSPSSERPAQNKLACVAVQYSDKALKQVRCRHPLAGDG